MTTASKTTLSSATPASQELSIDSQAREIPAQKPGAPVTRQVHILNEGYFWPFVFSWLEMTLSIVAIPLTLLFVWFFDPMVRLVVYLLNSCSRSRLKEELIQNGASPNAMEKMNGHEYFWLADNDSDKRRGKRIQSSSVVVFTVENANQRTGLTTELLKFLIQTRVLDQRVPRSEAPLFPRFSQKLEDLACGKAWVEDVSFDIENHVFEYEETVSSASKFLQVLAEIAGRPFATRCPRWRVYFLPSYPHRLSTVIFNCDPAMADGVYLLHILHDALADFPPIGFGKRNFGAFVQDFDGFRSAFSGVLWFFKNLFPFRDKNELITIPARRASSITYNSFKALSSVRSATTTDVSLSESPPMESLSKRRFLVYGPVSLSNVSLIRDVTKASLDELFMSVLTSSLRAYLQHYHGIVNPYDITANISVALQTISNHSTSQISQIPEVLVGNQNNTENANVSALTKLAVKNRNDEESPQSSLSKNKDVDLSSTNFPLDSTVKSISNISMNSKFVKTGQLTNNAKKSSLELAAELTQQFYTTPALQRPGFCPHRASPPHPGVLQNSQMKPRSLSVGVPPTSSNSYTLYSQLNQNNIGIEQTTIEQETQGYAKTVPAKSRSHLNTDSSNYNLSSTASSSPLSHKTKLSTLKIRLPTGVEGVVPSLWHIKHRFLEEKVDSNHISMYLCSKFFGHILPGWLHTKLMNRLYGKASISYHSMTGSETRLLLDGNQIRNIFFWGPLKKEECIGISLMTYLDNLTLTLNVDEGLPNPEKIFDLFVKKLEDLKELLKYRRVKHQPRLDTIFVPFSRTTWEATEPFEDETGEEAELRSYRKTSRFRSFSSMRKNSLAALNSLMGASTKRSRTSMSAAIPSQTKF